MSDEEGNRVTKRVRADRQFYLAITFIEGFFFFLGLAFWNFVGTMNTDSLSFIGTLFGGWVGTIIGFYFGQKPVEQVREALKEEQKRTKELQDWLKGRAESIRGS